MSSEYHKICHLMILDFFFLILLCLTLFLEGVFCQSIKEVPDISIRLVNKGDLLEEKEGRVEILYKNIWGTVCDDGFNKLEAGVVCWMLGFTRNGTRVEPNGFYGGGSGPVLLDDVKCKGDESSLAACMHKGWMVTDCRTDEAVGVRCLGARRQFGSRTVSRTPSPESQSSSARSVTSPCVPNLNVRLSNSTNGMVELKTGQGGNAWYLLCNSAWSLESARVICSSLCLSLNSVLIKSVPSATFSPVWSSKLNCRGSEADVKDCPGFPRPQTSRICVNNQFAAVNCRKAEQLPPRIGLVEVSLSCPRDNFLLEIGRNWIESLDQNDVTLLPLVRGGFNRNQCTFIKRQNSTHINISIPLLSSCGANITSNSTFIRYDLKIRIDKVQPLNAVIRRSPRIDVPITCFKERRRNLTSWIDLLPVVAPPASSTHRYQFNFQLCQHKVALGSQICGQIELMDAQSEDVTMVVRKFYATPLQSKSATASANLQYDLEDNSCAEDGTIQSNYMKGEKMYNFTFQVFQFARPQTRGQQGEEQTYPNIWLHADVFVCTAKEQESNRLCTRECEKPSSRVKRSLVMDSNSRRIGEDDSLSSRDHEVEGNVWTGSSSSASSTLAHLTQGPIAIDSTHIAGNELLHSRDGSIIIIRFRGGDKKLHASQPRTKEDFSKPSSAADQEVQALISLSSAVSSFPFLIITTAIVCYYCCWRRT